MVRSRVRILLASFLKERARQNGKRNGVYSVPEIGRNRVAVGGWAAKTQGSSCLATLGYEAESLQDFKKVKGSFPAGDSKKGT